MISLGVLIIIGFAVIFALLFRSKRRKLEHPLAGGEVHVYEPGATLEKNTYSDESLITPRDNPVVLDGAGNIAEIYKIKIPWGCWDVNTGYWFPNTKIKMSWEEQYQQNKANGYKMKGIIFERPERN